MIYLNIFRKDLGNKQIFEHSKWSGHLPTYYTNVHIHKFFDFFFNFLQKKIYFLKILTCLSPLPPCAETLKNLCRQHYERINKLENQKYDLEYVVKRKDFEVHKNIIFS